MDDRHSCRFPDEVYFQRVEAIARTEANAKDLACIYKIPRAGFTPLSDLLAPDWAERTNRPYHISLSCFSGMTVADRIAWQELKDRFDG